MYIEPGTNIRILHNIPLDKTYDHTIYFSDATAQRGYFIYNQKYNLSNYTYQRVQRGVARVGIKADDLYDCNYMMFQNTNYGNKWFYAFITSVEFINNETSQITFELDVMQTWHFDYTTDYCFVEREHTETDTIGGNILPEPVTPGEYVYNNLHPIGITEDGQDVDLTTMSVIVAIVDISDQQTQAHGLRYDGIYGGAELYAFGVNNVTGINGLISTYTRNPNAIVSIYMCPSAFIDVIDPNTHKISGTATGKIWDYINDTPITLTDTINGYLPKNAKLYTYPYNFYHVDNNSGAGLNFRYEFFGNLTPSVRISAMITQPVRAILRARNYKGSRDTSVPSESITLSNYPLCSWSVDSYQAWVAQTSVPYAIDMIKNVTIGLGSLMSAVASQDGGKVASAESGLLSGTFGAVMDRVKQGYQASIATDITVGSTNNGGINVADGTNTFYCGRCSITAQYAKMIDDFFTRFGYAVNCIKQPNRNSRPHWNYVKTAGCTLTGSVPADDMDKICRIYDHGITFWKYGSEVGNYSLNNSLLPGRG